MRIEIFKSGDYKDLGGLLVSVYPDYPGFLEEIRHMDATRKPPLKAGRYLAWEEGRLLGMAEYHQYATQYHPRKFNTDLLVRPDDEGRGIGEALYAHLMDKLSSLDPEIVWITVREDKTRGRRFAETRGFTERMRSRESRLNLEAFDPERFAVVLTRCADQGCDIVDLTELANDPERDRKLYELRNPIIADVPAPGEVTEESFEQFLERFWKNPALIPEACFIARSHGRLVGYSQLFDSHEEPLLYTGLTGVLRDYRGRGLAKALKVRGLTWAKAAGFKHVMTWNESRNVEMLAINEQLGFESAQIWIDYEKICGSTNEAGERKEA